MSEEKPEIKRCFIDSNIFVDWKINSETNHSVSKSLIDDYVLDNPGDFEFYTSYFSLLEVASAVIRKTQDKDKAQSLLFEIINNWKEKLNLLEPIEKKRTFPYLISQIIETALELKMPTGDAIQAHIFLSYSNTKKIIYFITWNKDDFRAVCNKHKSVQLLNPKEFMTLFPKVTKTTKTD